MNLTREACISEMPGARSFLLGYSLLFIFFRRSVGSWMPRSDSPSVQELRPVQSNIHVRQTTEETVFKVI